MQTLSKQFLPLIEKKLEELLTFQPLPEKRLYDAARYAVFTGGKRLRPLITLATTSAFQKDSSIALSPACALELLHTYSLIHDDLPCMDDDDFRRGKPTVHKEFDEATAVLAGDFLLTYAFEVLAKSEGLDAAQKIELVSTLAHRSGGHGLIGGQILDLKQVDHPTIEQVRQTHLMKTGDLITCAFEFGAIIGKASFEDREKIRYIGQTLGLAYQIIDDVIDVTASEKKHGQPVTRSTDLINGKATYVTLLGIEEAQKKAKQLLQSAHAQIESLPQPDSLLRLSDYLVDRKY